MGFETIFFYQDEVNAATTDDIIVADVSTSKNFLKKNSIEYHDYDYPQDLQAYLKRKIWRSTINVINANPEMWPVFVKPIEDKLFTGRLIKSPFDLIGCGNENSDVEIWCSFPVNFLSEYRCFVRYGKILDIRRYKGSYKHSIDYDVVESVVKNYKHAPAGYAIDFGVTDSGDTLLIEVNDGFALGDYGLFYIDYAKLLSARWCGLVGIKDECNF